MLLLVKPQFWLFTDVLTTLSSMKEVIAQDQDKINDAIIAEFKKHYPEEEYTIARLERSEYYTITTEKPFHDVFVTLKDRYDINPNWNLKIRTAEGEKAIHVDTIIFNNFANRYGGEYIPDEELYRMDENSVLGYLKSQEQILSDYPLNGLNLSDTKYSGSTFSWSDLTGSIFKTTELIYTGFFESILDNADLTNTDIRSSNFINASAKNAKFTYANVKFSNFTGANLTGADLTDADFRHTNLTGAILTGCKINENTRFYGADLTDAIYGDTFSDMNIEQYGDDEDYDRYLDQQMQGEYNSQDYDEMEYEAYAVEDQLAEMADKTQESVVDDEENAPFFKYPAYPDTFFKKNILNPLVIEPTSKASNHAGAKVTFEDIVNLLDPKINNVKRTLSHMEPNKWYGIASLGKTDPAIWEQVGVEGEPRIGAVFKCKTTPPHKDDEAIVYETVPECMAVHEISRKLDINKIFEKFLDTVGRKKLDREYQDITKNARDDIEKLQFSAKYLYNFILTILAYHTADETEDSWTHIYDDKEKRKQLVKHAVFNSEEGIMYHPRFDNTSHPQDILLLIMFLESLPYQVQAAWAQNYIKEFIEGYGQSIETFDRTIRSDMGFIASCLNGNLEKFLLSIRTAIIQFYPLELEEETEKDKLQTLKNAVTGSEFQIYFATVEDINGPTVEGYKNYIRTNASLKAERRDEFLALLEDPEIVKMIEDTIRIMSGGKKQKHIKRRKTNKYMKSGKHKKTIKKRMLSKHKKTIKKPMLKKPMLKKPMLNKYKKTNKKK